MAKLKAVVFVIVLVGAAAAGGFFGLNNIHRARVAAQVDAALNGVDTQILEHCRVKAFHVIQKVSSESRNEKILSELGKIRPAAEGATADVARTALQTSHDALIPVLEEIQKKLVLEGLLVITSDGRSVAQVPTKEEFGESLRGLPAVGECLAGVYRDGFYELSGKLSRIGAAPLLDNRGTVAGCLLGINLISDANIDELSGSLGLKAAVFLRGKVVATSLDQNLLAPLASKLDSQEIIRFGDPGGDAPWTYGGEAFAARAVSLPGGTDGLHVAAVFPLAELLAPWKSAQFNLLLACAGLLVLGLIGGLFFFGQAVDPDAKRLNEAVKNLADGSTTLMNTVGYSGIFSELAQNIEQLASSRGRAQVPPMQQSVSEILSSPPTASAARAKESELDFESLLAGGRTSQPAPRPAFPGQDSAQPALVPTPPPEPAQSARSFEPMRPAMPARPATPVSMPPQAARRPTPTAASGGPRVELPGELAGFFEDQEKTRETPPSQAPSDNQAFTSPSSVPPSISLPPLLDLDNEQIKSSDYRPDATVIAHVPDELLRAAFTDQKDTVPVMASIPPPGSFSPGGSADAAEAAHFRETFEQFVNTKKQCGESTVGLTFDKFAEKLRKNTDELKARYKCASVKFNVYVKSGKAALKATPSK